MNHQTIVPHHPPVVSASEPSKTRPSSSRDEFEEFFPTNHVGKSVPPSVSLNEIDAKARQPLGVPPLQQTVSASSSSTPVEVPDAPVLVRRKGPNVPLQQEKPNHRVFLELAAKGFSHVEIAQMTGYTAACVNNALRQEHIQQTLADRIREVQGADEQVVEYIKEGVLDAVKIAGEIMRDPTAPKQARLAALNVFLDRRYGKPNQPINRGTEVDLNNLTDSELASMMRTN